MILIYCFWSYDSYLLLLVSYDSDDCVWSSNPNFIRFEIFIHVLNHTQTNMLDNKQVIIVNIWFLSHVSLLSLQHLKIFWNFSSIFCRFRFKYFANVYVSQYSFRISSKRNNFLNSMNLLKDFFSSIIFKKI
jgi:hypothetical protein